MTVEIRPNSQNISSSLKESTVESDVRLTLFMNSSKDLKLKWSLNFLNWRMSLFGLSVDQDSNMLPSSEPRLKRAQKYVKEVFTMFQI